MDQKTQFVEHVEATGDGEDVQKPPTKAMHIEMPDNKKLLLPLPVSRLH